MKKLVKIKLIHWHSFLNETISLHGSALLSGENGAGKSTILDAIQFVIMASKNNFNKAAHEAGNRKLTGYVRYKTGRENKPYERTGNVTSHVALEFYEEEKGESFVAGAVVDSASEDSEKTIWYLLENRQIEDDLFLDGETVYSIDVFRKVNKVERYFKTQTEAKAVFRHKFGRLEEKFFELVPKSLAFKPIDDIKDFVYSYVLDKKEVNIEELRENIMTYQSLKVQLLDIKHKVGKLEQIIGAYENARKSEQEKKEIEYFLAKLFFEQAERKLEKTQQEILSHRNLLEVLRQQEAATKELRESSAAQYNHLLAECKSNQEFLALDAVKKELEQISQSYENTKKEKAALQKKIQKSIKTVKELEKSYGEKILKSYWELFSGFASGNEMTWQETEELYPQAVEALEQLIAYKQEMVKNNQKREFELQGKKQEMLGEKEKLQKKRKKLEKKKLVYDPKVLKLKAAIEKELKQAGREGSVEILCELLNVSRETWKNAVEGYLNQQRFYLLVEPENFDLAVSAYDALHRREQFYGVGIINTAKLGAYDKAPEGSLASVVETKNPHARRFINMLLGRVMCCERAEELKQYEISMTPDCIRYQNHVVSAISPKHYEIPYIGADAYKIQREQVRLAEAELEEQLLHVQKELERIQAVSSLCDTKEEMDIKYGMDIFMKEKKESEKIRKLSEEKKELTENANYIEKQIMLEKLEQERKQLDAEYEALLKKQGEAEKMLKLSMEEKEVLLEEKKKKEAALFLAGEKADGSEKELEKKYYEFVKQKNTKKKPDGNMDKGMRDFEALRKKLQGTCSRVERALQTESASVVSFMQEYRFLYQFGAEASMENYGAFYAEYDKLKNSEILNYEERAEQAREASEQEFKEQFLAKLQENIKQAQKEFKELNESLEGIPFGREHYRFECMPAKKYEKFYQMIMSDFNVMSGVSIFSGAFHEDNREVIEELFDRLLSGGENGAALVEEFTDYRSYMDYDIRMEHEDGSYSYYSRVCKEKSGGETQTPFYVTVAASFVQLYQNGIGGDSIGIVLFDEAFHNMDDERIGGVLEFFRELPLQLLIAAPPEKIQYIAPLVDSTLLVMQGDGRSYVEEFSVR